jgi:hypothetical protein
MYKNKINFNCQKYESENPVYPDNCYNCMGRDGYPRNLGGDKQCKNFKMYERRKPDSIKILKREVWDLFSEWVRRSEADKDGYCICVTCGRRDKYTNFQAGHFIHGTSFLIPDLVHPQCPQCNGFKAGMAIEYKEWMLKKYGQAHLDKLEYQAKKPTKLSLFDLQTYKKLYQGKLKKINV